MYRHAGLASASCPGRKPSALTAAIGLAFVIFAGLGPAQAIEPAPSASEEKQLNEDTETLREGWHVVRPGDTLESITRRYLGKASLWQENWKKNEGEVRDPNLIHPGDRLRILLHDSLPPSGALVSKISNRVENELLPLTWKEAVLNDILQPKDSLRTFEKSSAELLFFDETHLVLSESSLVLVADEPQIRENVERTQIEIRVGQADLSGVLPQEDQGIEIILGDARVEPRGDAKGAVSTRTRMADEKSAQLMVYTGEGAIEAGGEKVAVPSGMGTSVTEGAPPAPPEKLLPAPGGLEPAPKFRDAIRRPVFRWGTVEGARDYTVEVCQDARCGALLERAVGIQGTNWQPKADLPVQALFWRVNATSPSGLDGYPSAAVNFEILDRPDDDVPPTARVALLGPQAKVNDRILVGPGFEIEVTTEDVGTGVKRWWPVVDGEETTVERLAGPWESGEHTVEIVAEDKAGNQSTTVQEFVYDPDPPRMSWGLQGVGEFGRGLTDIYGEDGPEASEQGRQVISAGGRAWYLDSDFTQVIVKPNRRKAKLADVPEGLTRERGMWILAEDLLCNGVTKLRYELEDRSVVGSRQGEAVLVVDAQDCVGNRARIAWPLR